jgi:molybdenum cofactor sulfurtransferase
MALIRPRIDLENGYLEVAFHASPNPTSPLRIPLISAPSDLCNIKSGASRVCGDKITALTYTSPHIIDFFTTAVGIPCTLARMSGNRHFKPHLAKEKVMQERSPNRREAPILLSNESPILLINRSSVDRLNEDIRCSGGKLAHPDVFRGNIVIRETSGGGNEAYAEDGWKHVKIGQEYFQLLGPCRRCHMVCVDQETAEKNEEPYVTLAKTRRIGGRVLFGQHAVHLPVESRGGTPRIRVGDVVRVWESEEEVVGL